MNNKRKVHPLEFMLWVAMGSIMMMFAGLTSAYIVRMAAGNWNVFKMPEIFFGSTAVIALSSLTLFWTISNYKKDNFSGYRIGLGITFILGCLFLLLQLQGWSQLQGYGIRLDGNPSGAFLFIICLLHGLHIVGGIVILFIFLLKSFFKNDMVKQLLDEVNPERLLGLNLLSTYWHFVGILWLYLFIFLWYNSL